MTVQINPDLPQHLINDHSDEIDLRQLIDALWGQRRLIGSFIIGGAVLGIALSLMSTRYVSEDLFLVGVPIDNYKRYESMLFSGTHLKRFLSQAGPGDAEVRATLQPLVDNPALLSSALKPEFSFTDKDAKAFGVRVEQPGSLLGIRVRHESRQPIGSGPVSLLAEYVRDTVIRVDLGDSLITQCVDNRSRELTLRNEQIKSDFTIAQEQKREATLRGIIASRPEAASMGSRQIVAIEKGTERFLPPVAQLTAVEILIADLRLEEAGRQRDLAASALKRDYYCKAEAALGTAASGLAFIGGLKDIQTSVFAGKDKRVDVVEQTWNELDLQRAEWTNSYLSRMRFAASLDGVEFRQRKPGLTMGLSLGLVFGGMLGLFVAAARGWWRFAGGNTEISK